MAMRFFAVSLLALAGCATQPPPEREEPVDGSFARHGRFAAKTEVLNQAPEAVQGGFVWRDTGVQLTLELTNPFGSTLARVSVLAQGATLERSNGEIIRASTPDDLIEQVLGQKMPVQGLRSWFRTQKQSLPGMRVLEQDAQGRIVSFEQAGWTARLSNFDAVGPRLISLVRAEAGRNISIRLVID
jgi:outer membrane lipoprotein LolB